jgi:hypothetical protein
MKKFPRYQLVNIAYRGGAALLIIAALVLLALDFGPASIVASVLGAAWLVGGAAAQYLFDPAITRWINEEHEPEPATGETIRL